MLEVLVGDATLRAWKGGGRFYVFSLVNTWLATTAACTQRERTWTFFWADGAATDSHDVNWWFPTSEANNSAYANTGKTAPFYVWGTSGWGGQLSGLERSDGGSALAAAPATAAGVPHTATYYALNGTQYFILDGAQIDSTLPM